MQWFDVDRKGLAQLLERKGKRFVLFELIQNAWDEQTSEVQVVLERIPGTPRVRLEVTDNNPEGFANLSHAFTLFAQSAKKAEAEKRGRFNLGEKLVLALCDEAQITSTKGTIVFDSEGRRSIRRKTEAGSVFSGTLRMTAAEMQDCAEAVRSLIVPPGIRTVYNGEELAQRKPLATLEATLATEVADEEGHLRPTQRKTRVAVYEPLPGERPMLYELGIPVVETDDRWHLDVHQKVPVNFDRDNVPPTYLARVRALALETMREHLTNEDANAPWVRDAVQRQAQFLSDGTIERVMALRFGEKRVAYDPSDSEANSLAVAQGYTLVHGGQLSKTEWEAVRRSGALLPAGRVTPSPRPYSVDGKEQNVLPREKWTPAMAAVADYAIRLGAALLGTTITVRMVSDVTWPFVATYGSSTLTFNLGRLGHKWFSGPLPRINELLIHEFAHHSSPNHLSSDYHDALSRLGAELTQLALEQPELFRGVRPVNGA